MPGALGSCQQLPSLRLYVVTIPLTGEAFQSLLGMWHIQNPTYRPAWHTEVNRHRTPHTDRYTLIFINPPHMKGIQKEAIQVPCCEENSTHLWATIIMSVLSSVKFCVCVSNSIKDTLTCCAVKYWMHVRCLWHWDVLLLTGLWWQTAILSATDNAAADFGLVFWLQWQQVCWQGEDGVDGSGEKYLTCLEQSRYLIKLVAADITVYFVEKKKHTVICMEFKLNACLC